MFHFAFEKWSLSFITCLHDSQTQTLLPRGTSTWSNIEERHLQAKETNKKKCDLSSRRVRLYQHTCRTHRPCFLGGGTFPRINPRPCERGLRDWRTIRVDTPKRICLKTYACARSLSAIACRGVHCFTSLYSAARMSKRDRIYLGSPDPSWRPTLHQQEL